MGRYFDGYVNLELPIWNCRPHPSASLRIELEIRKRLRFLPVFECENAAEADGVDRTAQFGRATDAEEFDGHLGRISGVAIAKLDHIVAAVFETRLPMFLTLAVFDALRPCDNLGEKFPVQVEVEDGLHSPAEG